MPAAMTGWFVQKNDYLLFFTVVVALWAALGTWLRRTNRLGDLPKGTWLLLIVVAGGGWWVVNRAGLRAQKELRRQVELLVPFYVEEMQKAGHARLPDKPSATD